MAQVTKDMCEHIIAAADRGERFPLTVNEMRQLAWLAIKGTTSAATVAEPTVVRCVRVCSISDIECTKQCGAICHHEATQQQAEPGADEREEFEREARRWGMDLSGCNGVYTASETHRAWCMWQVATKSKTHVILNSNKISEAYSLLAGLITGDGLPSALDDVALDIHDWLCKPVSKLKSVIDSASPKTSFDVWAENPYTKKLQKSIAEDYLPRDAAQSGQRAPVAEGWKRTQFAYPGPEDFESGIIAAFHSRLGQQWFIKNAYQGGLHAFATLNFGSAPELWIRVDDLLAAAQPQAEPTIKEPLNVGQQAEQYLATSDPEAHRQSIIDHEAEQQAEPGADERASCDAAYERWTTSPDFRQYNKPGFDAGYRAAQSGQRAGVAEEEK